MSLPTPPFFRALRDNRGLTLLELMFVVAILAVLAAIAIPHYLSYIDRARYASVLHTMKTLEREILAFNIINGRFPETLADIGFSAIRDPWGNSYQYLNSATAIPGQRRKLHGVVPVNNDFDLYSMGPDGQSNPAFTADSSRDDIVRANNGGYFGKVSQYY